jgi:hypothetical protein
VQILEMTPSSPQFTAAPRPLDFRLRLTNTTANALHLVELDPAREVPIDQQPALEALIADPQPSGGDTQPMPTMKLSPIGPHASVTIDYRTTAGGDPSVSDICLCGTGVYPIDFTVQASPDANGTPAQVGFAQTYLPSFLVAPKPVQVSWVWPLIDRPHRTTADRVFVDDDLAASVKPGGRLDRALQVVQQVEPGVRLTLVIDPELIDELATMAAGYQVREPDGSVRTGTGGPAAKAWLSRLEAVVPNSDINLTAPDDPDVDAMSAAGVAWTAEPSDAGQARAILAGAVGRQLAWPAGETITSAALGQVVADSSTAVLVNDATITGGADSSPRPAALATLPRPAGSSVTPTAVVLDHVLEQYATKVISRGQLGTAGLSALVAGLAVRAAQDPLQSHYVTMAPSRYVDADVPAATRAIVDTSHAVWAQSLTISQALKTIHPADRGPLRVPAGAADDQISAQLPAAMASAQSFVTDFGSALLTTADRRALLGGLSSSAQRCVSTAWRVDPGGGAQCAADFDAIAATQSDAVGIDHPSTGSYTLASSSAPLFVNLHNDLSVPVKVRVALTTVNGVAGFRTDPIPFQVVQPHQHVQVRISAHVQRSGRFQVDAGLLTPAGTSIGNTVRLSIRSTALGSIGVIITAAAGGVLLLALLIRLIRRFRHRSRPAPPTPAPPVTAGAAR